MSSAAPIEAVLEATENTASIAHVTLHPPEDVPLHIWELLAEKDGNRWAIKERNAQGEVIGTAYRYLDGRKGFKRGGKRGLIYQEPLDEYAGSSILNPIFVCEGASDTAAIMGLELDAVGVPMAKTGGQMLAELLKGRHAVVVQDADQAGRDSARKIAGEILPSCESVRVIVAPMQSKDAREAVRAGATSECFLDLAQSTPVIPHVPLASAPGRDEFAWVSANELPLHVEPAWLWEGYLVRGAITLLTGIWKGGKTVLITHLLRDLYLGTGLVSKAIDGPTLVVSEEPLNHWSGRDVDFEFDNRVYFLRRPSLARCTGSQWKDLIRTIIEKVQDCGAELVIIDALPNIWSVTNENDAAEVSESISILRDITEAGASLLLVHHPRKGDGGIQTASRGSGALPSFADILVDLGKLPSDGDNSNRRLLKALGRFGSEPPEQVFELTDEGYVAIGVPSVTNESDQLEMIAELLAVSGEKLSVVEVHGRWSRLAPIGKNKLRELLRKGSGGGLWTESGKGSRGDPYRYSMNLKSSDSSRLAPDA